MDAQAINTWWNNQHESSPSPPGVTWMNHSQWAYVREAHPVWELLVRAGAPRSVAEPDPVYHRVMKPVFAPVWRVWAAEHDPCGPEVLEALKRHYKGPSRLPEIDPPPTML